jgi:queuosine precursor transporter
MNEIIFLLHIITVISFALVSLFIGRCALVSFVCLQGILANIFVVKQIRLFGLDVTCGDVFIVGAILGLNLLQEYYGKKIVKNAILIGFLGMVFYLVMTKFLLFYEPNSFDFTHKLFEGIFQFLPRITAASIFVHFLIQVLSYWFYGFLKNAFAGNYLVARNAFVLLSTQLLDTILFSFLGLYGIVGSILSVIIMSFTIKAIVVLVSAPFISFSKVFVRQGKNEQI